MLKRTAIRYIILTIMIFATCTLGEKSVKADSNEINDSVHYELQESKGNDIVILTQPPDEGLSYKEYLLEWTPYDQAKQYILLLENPMNGETVASYRTNDPQIKFHISEEMNLGCEGVSFFIAAFDSDENLIGTTEEKKTMKIKGYGSHVFDSDGICQNCWYHRSGKFMRLDYKEMCQVSKAGSISDTWFDMDHIENVYYLRSIYDYSHTALLLVDDKRHGLHLSYYGDGFNLAATPTDVGVALMRASEIETFFRSGYIGNQILSGGGEFQYYTYYDMIDLAECMDIDGKKRAAERCLQIFDTAVTTGLDYDLFRSNCDHVLRWVLFEEISDNVLPAASFCDLWKDMKSDGATYSQIDSPKIGADSPQVQWIVKPYVKIDALANEIKDPLIEIETANAKAVLESVSIEQKTMVSEREPGSANGAYVYRINDSGEAIIDRWNQLYSGNANVLVIPDRISGYLVTGIGENAFKDYDELIKISLPDSITQIGNSAFMGCTSLETVILPNGIKELPEELFEGCTNLKEITLPDSITQIGNNAFKGCTSLETVILPNEIKELPEGLFSGCINLKEIKLTDSIEIIGKNCFYNCSRLDSIQLSACLHTIGYGAFSNCSKLSNILLPDSLKEIGSYAFAECINLTDIIVPEGVTSIRDWAFANCSEELVLSLPMSLEYIDSLALYNTDGHVIVYRGSYAENWAANDFSGSFTYESQHYIPGMAASDDQFAYVIRDDNTVTITAWLGEGTSVIIPDNIDGYPVTEIGIEAFYRNERLTEVILPKTIKVICESAFYYCTSLKEIVLPENIERIESSAFLNCPLEAINFPKSLTLIGSEAFKGTKIREIKIGPGIVSVGDSAFNGSYATSVTIESANTSFGKYVFQGCRTKEISLPEGMVAIPESFLARSSIEYIDLPSTIREIGSNAFGDTRIKNIQFPQGLEKIGKSAFSGCTELDALSIPDSVIRIDEWAFSSCNGLKDIVIPEGVQYLGKSVFLSCDSLQTVDLPVSLSSIGDNLISDCPSAILKVSKDSYAHQWAEKHQQTYVIKNSGDDFLKMLVEGSQEVTSANTSKGPAVSAEYWFMDVTTGREYKLLLHDDYTYEYTYEEPNIWGGSAQGQISVGTYQFMDNTLALLHDGRVDRLQREVTNLIADGVEKQVYIGNGLVDGYRTLQCIYMKGSPWGESGEAMENNSLSDVENPNTTLLDQDEQEVYTVHTDAVLTPVSIDIKNTQASTHIESKKASYDATMMFDGEEKTSWQFSLKNVQNVSDVYVDIAIDSPKNISRMKIKNGFWKITDGLDQYPRNGRLKKIELSFLYTNQTNYTDELILDLVDDHARANWQVFELGDHPDTESIRLRVLDVYRGSKFKNDVAVSEIEFEKSMENDHYNEQSMYEETIAQTDTPTATPEPIVEPETHSIEYYMEHYQLPSSEQAYFEWALNFAVYTGPSRSYYRANNGKAEVSTTGGLKCYGTDDDGDYYVIRYTLNNGNRRIGYIRRKDISGSYYMRESPVPRCDVDVVFIQDATLTDDPGVSNSKLCTIRKGTRCKLVFFRDDYACVDLEDSDVGRVRGFVKYTAIDIAE